MKENVLVGVLLAIALVTPAFAWLFYIWHRSHVARMHQEGQIFNRRNRDRAQANYDPANGSQGPRFGSYVTPSGWVRPKTRGLSHDLRPPQYVHPRQPTFTGNPNSDQHFQGPNRVSTHSPPHTANQQPNPLSKRQQRKQRALQNKQKQQREREQQQSQNEQRGQQNQNQRKQKNKNHGQDHQKSPTAHSPKAQGGQGEQYDPWGNTEGQNDRTSNHGGSGWGNEEAPGDNQENTGQNDNNNDWGNNFNNDQGEQRNSVSGSPRRGSRDNHNSPRERNSRWDSSRPASPDRASGNDADFLRGGWGQSDDGAQRNNHSRSNHSNEDHNRYNGWGDNDTKSYHKKSKRDHHTSPNRKSRKEADTRSGWGQNDSGTRQNSPRRSVYPDEDHNRHYGWGDDDAKSYHKKSKRNRNASPERKSRGRSSPNRDWGQSDRGERGNSRTRSRSNSGGHEEERRGGGSPTWSQDRNVHRDKKKKKERWQIELEENEKMCRSRSRSRERSDAGWDNRSQGSGWKETQKW
ncbi:hypothetical protein N7449_003771 [Penicillium cf. viridicatum]|uniref:Uncharacterized protein n=1 Tax=Penicillium cf. viridicatum TaxID=2972119 RepID=A0A9W9MXU7_9EURO|nr:hypothetical protein N7449_003771 [Penicillium cf. viridicatum]